ncbi:MAG: hypothetical protein AAF108_02180 [Planctomycetota bacterium]
MAERRAATRSHAADDGRPSIRVFFQCANAYQRVLRDADGRAYVARCPRCGLSKRFVVGSGGTGQRFFELTCR